MFKTKPTEKEIRSAAWGYFKSDQLGPKNYKDINEVIQAMISGEKLRPLVCWSNGKVSWGTEKMEVWHNDGDEIRKIPVEGSTLCGCTEAIEESDVKPLKASK